MASHFEKKVRDIPAKLRTEYNEISLGNSVLFSIFYILYYLEERIYGSTIPHSPDSTNLWQQYNLQKLLTPVN